MASNVDVSVVFIPDCHIPYLDEAAWNDVLKFIVANKPYDIVVLGDFLDCYALSRYDKFPGHPGLNEEITEGQSRLAELRASSGNVARITYVEGNHEQRLSKYVNRHAENLGNAVKTVPELLQLDAPRVKWVPWGAKCFIGGIWVEHGDCANQKSGQTAYAMMLRRNVRVGVSGHTHRLGLVYRTTKGVLGVQQWAEAGSLCRPEMMEYVLFPDWQLGFVYADSNGALKTVLLRNI